MCPHIRICHCHTWHRFLLIVFSPAELLMSTDSVATKRNSSMIVQALVYYILCKVPTTTLKPVDGFGSWSDLNQHSADAELPPHQHLLLQKTSTIFHNGNAAPSTPCQSHAHPWPDLRLWCESRAWPDRSDSLRLPAFS